jgi:hypothetical protein
MPMLTASAATAKLMADCTKKAVVVRAGVEVVCVMTSLCWPVRGGA